MSMLDNTAPRRHDFDMGRRSRRWIQLGSGWVGFTKRAYRRLSRHNAIKLIRIEIDDYSINA